MAKDYWNAQCCALTRSGKRCSGGWSTAQPMTLEWDPIAGVGRDMPYVVLCHRHRHWLDRRDESGPRKPLAHGGWLGWLDPHRYYARVFAAPTGNAVARWWLDRARPCSFGDTQRRDAA